MSPLAGQLIEDVVMTVLVFVVGRALQKHIGRGSEGRRIHGTFVFWWGFACYFAGWFAGLLVVADSAFGRSGSALFGLLVGWLIGWLHGALVVWWRGAITRQTTLPGMPPGKDKI